MDSPMHDGDPKVLPAGTVVGGAYRVARPVAEGGMGVIYEVEQIATGARRALKVMHGHFAGDDKLRARFVREARLAALIPSDHVAQVVDAGQDEVTGALFIVMELLEGSTLSSELRANGPLPWAEAMVVLGQVAHALGAAHGMGVVHRDLKPANVFLARSRHASQPFTVKLLDFGIAKAVVGASEATGVVLGTPAWMAPEQTTIGAPIGTQADVWSFGLLAFLVLTGSHYFASAAEKSATTAAVLREVILDDLPAASERADRLGVSDRLPEGFDAWFARCVDRVPQARFEDVSSAFELLSRLPPPATAADVPVRALPRAAPVFAHSAVTAVETPRPPPSAPSDVSEVLAPTPFPSAVTAKPRGPGARLFGTAVAAMALVALVVAAVALVSRPGADPAAASLRTAPPTAGHVVLRMHGSNTIGADLAPALAEAFLAKRTAARGLVRRRSGPDEVVVEARDGDRTLEAVEIFAHGTATAFEDLGAGRCDLGMASRRVTSSEAARLSARGDLTSAASEHVVALDGIAVVVNPSNPITALDLGQISALFAGDVRRWSDVGGADASVVVHARDDKSGTYDTFRHLVLEPRTLVASAVRHESSDDLSDAVAADPRAVGFIGLPYVRSAKPIMVSTPSSEPLLPSPMTVSTEDYPLARRLYLYLPLGASTTARDFVDFALSEEGQRVVQSAGFVDLRPTCDPNVPPCRTCSREYQDAVRGACRLSLDFRFEPASTSLDTRALRDLQRLVAMMARPEYAGRSLVLIGFAVVDRATTNAPSNAIDASAYLPGKSLAAVADQLRGRGLHVDVARAFALRPAGEDETDDAREHRRRVEVWVR